MKNTTIVPIVAAIVVVAALAGSAFFAFNNDDENKVDFLVQDNYGMYAWIEGSGNTVLDAFENATKTNNIPFEKSTSSEGDGIKSLFGLETTKVSEGNYVWWAQYVWTGTEWTSSNLYMSNYSPSDAKHAVAVVYSDGSTAPADIPAHAKIDGKGDVEFQIETPSGMYVYFHGNGKTVMAAFENAASTYKLPFEKSVQTWGEGIKSLFGLETTKVSEDKYVWWTQYAWDGSGWVTNEKTMEKLTPADVNGRVAIVYGDGTNYPHVDTNSTLTILVQDVSGVYFWMEGSGKTVLDAFENAIQKSSFTIPYERSTSSKGDGIKSLFGLGTAKVSEDDYVWWAQYVWTGTEWSTSPLYMSNLLTADNCYFACVYGDGNNAPLVKPSDAVVYDSSIKNDLDITVVSNTGVYFQVGGNGKTAMAAFENAAATYKLPFEKSVNTWGEGIQSLFGLKTDVVEGDHVWWGQFIKSETGLIDSPLTMEKYSPADVDHYLCVAYGNGTAPVFPN